MVANQAVDISFSIGIAHFPEHGMDASSLLRKADIALNSAKRKHRKSIFPQKCFYAFTGSCVSVFPNKSAYKRAGVFFYSLA
jgi:hypothetical protein